MKRETNIILRIAFGIVVAVVILGSLTIKLPGDLGFFETKLSLAIRGVGGTIALFSALLLLIRAAEGVDVNRLLPLGFGVLAGVLCMTGSGIVALSLALAVAAVLIKDTFGHPRGGRNENSGGGGGGGGRPRRRPSGGGDKDQK